MKKTSKAEKQKQNTSRPKNATATSYRLKCGKTANGLSHYVMYGDNKEALL